VFSGLKRLNRVEIKEGVRSIKKRAFHAPMLETLILPETLSSVEEEAFAPSRWIKDLIYDGTKECWDAVKQGKDAYDFEKGPAVILVIGVNGDGKTTSIGKLAANYRSQGKRVLIASADTFRAAANEQLSEWAKRAGVDIIGAAEGSDPAAVVYDAVQAAKARRTDILLIDTAGRLHNKKNLMAELSKIDRIITREYPGCIRENWVVLDGTTGQNAIFQAREFASVTDLTGIILTKMDDTAKGGIAIAVQAELGISVKFIGVGEKIEDLQKFNPDQFVDAIFY
jgi:fused signal recognition particle receptor